MKISRIVFILLTASAPLLVYARHRSIPYIVSLVMDHSHRYRGGSGALISSTWVLTAAHCTEEPFVSHIQYGDKDALQGLSVKSSEILQRIKHPGFRKGNQYTNDIGLFRVNPVRLDVYGTLSAVDYNSLVGRPVEFCGYGRTQSYNIDDQFDRLMQFGKGIVTTCEESTSAGPYICVALKCTEQKAGFNFSSNNGGPMFYDGRIGGVISRSDDDIPLGRFTPLSPFITWIYQEINPQKVKKKEQTNDKKN